MILHCYWGQFWSHDTDAYIILSIISIKNEKLLNSSNNRRTSKFFRILWDIVVFRLGFVFAEYVEFYDKSHIYMSFGIILTQLYINFSRQEHQIELL